MKRLLLCLFVVALLAGQASAAVYPLWNWTDSDGDGVRDNTEVTGADASINGALFSSNYLQPTGTGHIQPFLKMTTSAEVEQAYNTDEKKKVLDDMPSWTSSLTLRELLTVVPPQGGVPSKAFLLDIDQQGTVPPDLLLTDLKIYVGPGLANYNEDPWVAPAATLVYDLDGPGLVDNTIDLDYRLDPGSGGGDMWAYIPVDAFKGLAKTDNVLLYSKFNQNNDGPEEWAAVVPAPAAVLLAALAWGAAGLKLRKFV
jgi:hypothetical protein